MRTILQECSAKASAVFSCVRRKSDKLDWMYQGGMVAKAEANKRVEEQQQAALPPPPSNVSSPVLPVH